jgi:hypothetical protein
VLEAGHRPISSGGYLCRDKQVKTIPTGYLDCPLSTFVFLTEVAEMIWEEGCLELFLHFARLIMENDPFKGRKPLIPGVIRNFSSNDTSSLAIA